MFVYDLWAPTMILPFLVAVFWYSATRIHAVVVSIVVGIFVTIAWRFGLGSPGDVGPLYSVQRRRRWRSPLPCL